MKWDGNMMGIPCRACLGYDSFFVGYPSGTWVIDFGTIFRTDSYGFIVVILSPHGYFGQENVLGILDKTPVDN